MQLRSFASPKSFPFSTSPNLWTRMAILLNQPYIMRTEQSGMSRFKFSSYLVVWSGVVSQILRLRRFFSHLRPFKCCFKPRSERAAVLASDSIAHD